MRADRVLFPAIMVYLLYTFCLAGLSHVGFPKDMQCGDRFPYLADKPVGEDGYYMLTIAWNIAAGRGIVYNYDMPTTGIQPLSRYPASEVRKCSARIGNGRPSIPRSGQPWPT